MTFFTSLRHVGFIAFAGALFISAQATAETQPRAGRPFLSPIFSGHMVLQRDKPNRFWGWTEPGAKVSMEIGGLSTSTVAGSDGKWLIESNVPAAGGPYELTFSGPQTITLKDVLVGDVWLCSGQSNMEVSLEYSVGGPEAVKAANQPDLRFCTVASTVAYAPAPVPRCSWAVCTPETAASFSAVAYYFAQRVQRDVKVPIGLILSAIGGSPGESWMSAAGLARIGEFGPQLKEIQRLNRRPGEKFGSFLMHWLDENDAGGHDNAWAQPGESEAGWHPVQIPGGFAALGVPATPAVGWFRRTITLPENYRDGPSKIFLGVIEKMDTTYINGRWIGASSWVENPRAYPVPTGVLHAGTNVIAIRVFKIQPHGGFESSADTLHLQLADGTSLPLAGQWLGRLSVDARPPFPLPLDFENYPTMPAVLYNGMIAPLEALALTGVIWYQGEANQTRPHQYRKLLPALIADWRKQFTQGDIPFYIAELPAFMARRDQPGTDGWTGIREAQAKTAQSVPHARVAVTVDTGDAANIHPHEKRAVGERLALLALAGTYHRPVAASGPIFRSMERIGADLRLKFDPVDGKLVAHGKEPGEFSVAGADRHWHWASARIDGDAVVVSSPEVSVPVAARYAWQANPKANLFNTAGLPAAPFRTDDWPSEPDR